MSRKLTSALILLMVMLVAVGAIWAGTMLAAAGRFDRADNLFFEADCSRVIANSTSFIGPQDRARVHPLHILIVAPIGYVLSVLFGSAKVATVVVAALCGVLVIWNVERVLDQQLRLSQLERLLFVGVLACSASQVTFSMVPDTHIMSAIGLSGMARALTPARVGRLQGPWQGAVAWLRRGGSVSLAWAILAVGMLGTSAVLIPAIVYVQMPTDLSRARRLLWGTAATIAVLLVVLGLHLGQRAVWPPTPAPQGSGALHARALETAISVAAHPARSDGAQRPAPASSVDRLKRYVSETWMHNSRWVTAPGKLPHRAGQLLTSMLVNTFYAPRFHEYLFPWVTIATASFEPWDFRHRAAGFLGSGAWLGLLLALTIRSRGNWASLARRPIMFFGLAVVTAYAVIMAVYGDEMFLYSPNWAFAVVLIAASLFEAGTSSPRKSGAVFRWALALATVCMAANSILHVKDLLAHFL